MGATRWEMLRVAVFPRVRSGLDRRGDARTRARDGRDDRGRARDRQQSPSHVAPVPDRATRWRRSSRTTSARRPTSTGRRSSASASCCSRITIVVNVIARVDREPLDALARRARDDRRRRPRRRTDDPRAWILRTVDLARGAASSTGSRPRGWSARCCSRSCPLVDHRRVRGQQGRRRHELELPHKDLPIVTQFAGGGIAPAIVGTLVITGVAALMAIPLGVLAAIYLNEYGEQKPTRAGHPLHGRRHDRRAVDRDGSVHRDDLGQRRTALRLLGLRGIARARRA